MSLVDASVTVAIMNEEAGFEELEKRIEDATALCIAAGSFRGSRRHAEN
jgi:uncharacterized protein with PIN domain